MRICYYCHCFYLLLIAAVLAYLRLKQMRSDDYFINNQKSSNISALSNQLAGNHFYAYIFYAHRNWSICSSESSQVFNILLQIFHGANGRRNSNFESLLLKKCFFLQIFCCLQVSFYCLDLWAGRHFRIGSSESVGRPNFSEM